jgi:outer membrane protein assembly factor BamB
MVSGQVSTRLFSLKDSIIGASHATGLPVTATRYIAPGKIDKWHWDGVSDNLLLELRELDKKGLSFKNEGTLNMIDLKTKDVKWTQKVNYNSSDVKQFGNYYFLTDKKKNLRLDPETGNALWESRCEFYFIDPALNIGIGYPVQSMSNKLSAIDLSNGSVLWNKEIDRTFGWNDAYMLNDSMLLISVNGIHGIDLASGSGWAYKAKTSKKEIGKMVGINILGIIFGILTNTYFYQSRPDAVSDMISNLLIDPDGNILLASRDRISRIDHSGNILWTTPLPEKITSKSSLFLIDSVVYMINRGYAQYNGGFSMIGDPYLAAFDLVSGNQLYLTIIPEKKEFIRNYQVIDDMLFIVFEDKITSYLLSNGTFIKEKTVELQKDEDLDAFVEAEGIYLKRSNAVFTGLSSDFSNYNPIKTSEGRIFILNDSLDTFITFGKEDLFYKMIDNPQYTFVSNNDSDFIVLDGSDNLLATFKAFPEMFLRDGKLYSFDNDSFWEINLNQLHQSPSIWESVFKQVSRFVPILHD